MNNNILLYLAKPIYGGWVSFTAHLSLTTNTPIYKIGNNNEKKSRDYGYNTKYTNITSDTLVNYLDNKVNIIITAIDKNYYNILPLLSKNFGNVYIIIHDPTEFNKKSKKIVLDSINNFRVITIRNLVSKLLLNTYGIKNTYKIHPYYSYNNHYKFNNMGNNTISISRIDYDKNIDIIVKANKLLKNKIEIYGDINERYIYHKLVEYDSFKKDDINSMFRGRFPKTINDLKNMLSKNSFVIDMSTISQDGGGTQYTFLEAIDNGCILILNSKWCNNISNSIWQHNNNCIVVENSNDLVDFLENGYKKVDLNKIYKNSLEILENAKNVNWLNVFSI